MIKIRIKREVETSKGIYVFKIDSGKLIIKNVRKNLEIEFEEDLTKELKSFLDEYYERI